MADIGVVGAGIVGLCTAYALSERGTSVRVYERGVPGNAQSGGESRLFRHAHDDVRLVAFARESRALWRAWSERLGAQLVSGDGALALGPAAEDRLRVLARVDGVTARPIDARELRERLPLLAEYSGAAMLDEGGGAIRTRAAVDGLVRALGQSLVSDDVISLRPTSAETVEVRTGGATVEHARVVVCAGVGTSALAGDVELALPVTLSAHVRATFAVRGDPPAQLACLQDSSGAFGENGVYAAPVQGNRHYSVGISQETDALPDGGLVDPGALATLAAGAQDYVRAALPGLDPEPVEYRHCWVTKLPWSSDGLAVWERPGILFVAGHNLFKLAPALGSALADAALGEGLRRELRPKARLGEAR